MPRASEKCRSYRESRAKTHMPRRVNSDIGFHQRMHAVWPTGDELNGARQRPAGKARGSRPSGVWWCSCALVSSGALSGVMLRYAYQERSR